jgi:ELWxxDGT repeat protein
MLVLNDTLYFAANDSTHGCELYAYDGIHKPQLVADLCKTNIGGSYPTNIIALNNKIYLIGETDSFNRQVWEYDPSTGNSRILTHIYSKGSYITALSLFNFNNELYIQYDDSFTFRRLLAKYNFQTGIIIPISDIYHGFQVSYTGFYLEYKGLLYFVAATGNIGQLYIYDGINKPVNTGISIDLVGNTNGASWITYNECIYFAQRDANNHCQLWKYDIKLGIAYKVADVNQKDDADLRVFCVYNNKLYFTAYNTVYGSELWCYDGIKYPYLVNDVVSGFESNDPIFTMVHNNSIYYSGSTKDIYELFRYTEYPTKINNLFIAPATTYPNPTNGNATLELNLHQAQTLCISLTDIHGRMIYNIPAKEYGVSKHNITIPMAQLSAGIYFYRIKDTNGKIMATGKLVKE